MLLWTLVNENTYTDLIYLATSLILLPYLWSAAFQVKLAVTGETYADGHGRTRDLLVGGVALGYAVWLVYAGGWQYLLIAGAVLPRRHGAVRVGAAGEPQAGLHHPSRSSSPSWRHLGRGRRADGHRQPVGP